jgi:hypothetical protein
VWTNAIITSYVNEVKECYSNSLRVEAATASLPPDLWPLPQIGANLKEEPDPGQLEGSGVENLEHLPPQEQAKKEAVTEDTEAEVAEAEDERKWLAEEKIRGLLDNQVTICQGNISNVWTVVSDYCNPNCLMEENGPGGLKIIVDIRSLPSSIWLCKIFLKFFLDDSLHSKVQQMNEYIRSPRSSKCKVFTETEFIVGAGLIIGAAEFSQQGKELFSNTGKKELEDDGDLYLSPMVPHPDLRTSDDFFPTFGGMKRRKKMVMSGGNSVVEYFFYFLLLY